MSQLRDARHFVLDTIVVALTLGVAKLRALITLPLIVKLLGTENYGIWSQTLTLSTVLANVFLLNIHLPLVRFVSADRTKAGPVYASVLFTNLAMFVVLATPMVFLIKPLSTAAMGKSGLDEFALITLVLVLVNNVRLINLNFYRSTDRIRLRSYIDMASTVLSVFVIFGTVLRHWPLIGVLAALAAWEGLVAVATTVHCFKLAGFARPDRTVIKQAFHYCLPLLPSGLAIALLDRADRFFISHHLGLVDVGVYSAAYALASGLLIFQAPMQFTLLPKVSALWASERELAGKYLSTAIHAFLALGIPCVCAMPILGPPMLRALGNADTGRASPMMIFLVAAGVLFWGVSLCLTNVFYAANRTGALARILVATAMFNIALNTILVPAMHLPGAALATVISYAAALLLLFVIGRRDLVLVWHRSFLLKCVLSATLMSLVLVFWSPRGKPELAGALVTGGLTYLAILIATRALRAEHWKWLTTALRR